MAFTVSHFFASIPIVSYVFIIYFRFSNNLEGAAVSLASSVASNFLANAKSKQSSLNCINVSV